jgi:hypothetical protein
MFAAIPVRDGAWRDILIDTLIDLADWQRV